MEYRRALSVTFEPERDPLVWMGLGTMDDQDEHFGGLPESLPRRTL